MFLFGFLCGALLGFSTGSNGSAPAKLFAAFDGVVAIDKEQVDGLDLPNKLTGWAGHWLYFFHHPVVTHVLLKLLQKGLLTFQAVVEVCAALLTGGIKWIDGKYFAALQPRGQTVGAFSLPTANLHDDSIASQLRGVFAQSDRFDGREKTIIDRNFNFLRALPTMGLAHRYERASLQDALPQTGAPVVPMGSFRQTAGRDGPMGHPLRCPSDGRAQTPVKPLFTC